MNDVELRGDYNEVINQSWKALNSVKAETMQVVVDLLDLENEEVDCIANSLNYAVSEISAIQEDLQREMWVQDEPSNE